MRMIAVPVVALQVAHQLEDLRLDGHVEGGGRFVGDQQARPADQRHRDHRPLAHAAGEPVRILVEAAARHPACAPGAALRWPPRARRCGSSAGGRARPRRSASPMVNAGLSDVIGSWKIIAIRLPRSSRSALVVQADQLPALQADRACRRCGRRRQQPHDRQRGDALAAAGLADDRQRPAGLDAEVDAVDRREIAAVGGEDGAQAPHLQQRRRDGSFAGPACSRLEPLPRCARSISSRSVDVRPDRRGAAGRRRTPGIARGSCGRGAAARRAARHDRRRAGRAPGSLPPRGSAAPPPAGRACHRRPPGRPPLPRAAAPRAAVPRTAGMRARSRRSPRGPASMLPATEKSASTRWPHQSMQAAPVKAAGSPRAPIRCSWRWSRPASAAVSACSTASGAVARRQPVDAGLAVERIHQRLGGQRTDGVARMDAERADREEAAGDGDAEAACRRRGRGWTRSCDRVYMARMRRRASRSLEPRGPATAGACRGGSGHSLRLAASA